MEHMKVILLQRVAKLGHIGDIVNVKPGYARNYLLPKKVAIRATNENIAYFEKQREQIERDNEVAKAAAQEVAAKMGKLSIVLVRQASEKDQLYGSVSNRDIAAAIQEKGYKVTAGQVNLNIPIKTLGVYDITVDLHPEVAVEVQLSVAKSEEEAKLQQQQASNLEQEQAEAIA